MIELYFTFTIIALILSLWNTYVLYRHRLIDREDVRTLIQVIDIVLSTTGVKHNPEALGNLLKLKAKYKVEK